MRVCLSGESAVNDTQSINQIKPRMLDAKNKYIQPDNKYRHSKPPTSIVNDVPSHVPQKPIEFNVLRSCGTAQTDQSATVAGKRTPCARPMIKRRTKINMKWVLDMKYMIVKANVANELVPRELA